MVTTLEKPRTELAAAKRASIYDDEKVAAAQALVERMRQAVVDAEAEFAAATERGVVNEIDALLTGENPSSGADEALRKLNIAREALALATKSLDVAAIHASG
ncbi:MAG: hypothetical protein IT426_00095, partial [Pirellulales bacterium]|nr:hypothetical protein [Pirellulales bacterium]